MTWFGLTFCLVKCTKRIIWLLKHFCFYKYKCNYKKVLLKTVVGQKLLLCSTVRSNTTCPVLPMSVSKLRQGLMSKQSLFCFQVKSVALFLWPRNWQCWLLRLKSSLISSLQTEHFTHLSTDFKSIFFKRHSRSGKA